MSRSKFRSRLTAIAAGVALLAPGLASADPVTIVASIFAISATTAAYVIIGATALVAYATTRGRAKARVGAQELQDRSITALRADPPHRVIYGRAETGGDVVAIFTSDKSAYDENGSPYTKPDAYKHLVVVWSSRQCHAINDIKIDGVSLGALDGSGWATGSEWVSAAGATPQGTMQVDGASSTATVPAGAAIISVVFVQNGPSRWDSATANVPDFGPYGYSLSGTTLTLPGTVEFTTGATYSPVAGDTWEINFTSPAAAGASTVRALHHLGDPSQTTDATLNALVPGLWTVRHRLRGRCYSVITLDLERQQFQGGPPSGLTADISGALVLDRRTSTTAWSENPALCLDDWLRSVIGFGVSLAGVDSASVIAAANACDVSTTFTREEWPADGVGPPATITTTGPRYSCNGVFTSSMGKEAVKEDLCDSMCGWASYGGNWRVMAGAWTPSVMDLTDDDLDGSIEIVQAGEPSGELFNAVRGSFVPAGSSIESDFVPYKNSTFVTADGKALWADVTLPFTNTKERAKNIARILVEQSRNGLVITYPAKMKAWPLQTGDRVRVKSTEYGFDYKYFRVTDWQFGLRSPVGLVLQEDGEDAYDLADAVVTDPTPNTGLPNPWVVPAIGGLAAESGTDQLLMQDDGTLTSRVKVTWTRSTAAYMQGGRVELAWRGQLSTTWTVENSDGDDDQAFITNVNDGDVLLISVTAVNSLGARSIPTFLSHGVLGKTEAPGDVADLAYTDLIGGASITWAANTGLDYSYTELREGASWAAGTSIFSGAATAFSWASPLGTYTVWAKHFDTSGNESVTAVSLVVVIVASSELFMLEASAAFVLPASYTGVVSSYAGAASTIKVLTGSTDDTVNWTLARADGSGVTSTLSSGLLTITAMSSGTDLSYVDVTATRTGYATLSRRIGVSKSKAGTNGTDGIDGVDGANGTRTGYATAYRWALTIPTAPTGTATYTWAGGGVSSAPTLWSLTPGATPVPGYTLWALVVTITNTNTTPTDSINWALGGIRSAGSSGDAGDSARIAYTAITSGTTLATGTRTSTGATTPPSTNAWGGSETWSMTPPSVSTGQTQWQTNGVYVKSTDTITWETPYLSYFKVGALSAITANLGTITAGAINSVTVDASTITGGLLQTAASGRRVVINESSSNTARFYDNAGGGTELLASIGPTSYGSSFALGDFGSITAGNATMGVRGRSYSYIGVFGNSSSGVGVQGQSVSNDGIFGSTSSTSTSFAGVQGYNNVSAGCAVKALATSGAIGVYSDASGNIAFKGEGSISIAKGTATHDPYGTVSVTRPTGASYSYYGMTEAGTQPIGIGIDTAHQCWIGVPTSGHNGVLSARYLTTGYNGTKVEGAFGCNTKAPQSSYSVNGASTDLATVIALCNQVRAALIANGICV